METTTALITIGSLALNALLIAAFWRCREIINELAEVAENQTKTIEQTMDALNYYQIKAGDDVTILPQLKTTFSDTKTKNSYAN